MSMPKPFSIGYSAQPANWEEITDVAALPRETILVQDGAPCFDIIHPDSPDGRAAAERIAAAVAPWCRAGQAPGMLVGTRARRVPERTAILLGDIYSNPSMLTLYARRAIAADKAYPGPGGYTVRTVFEPFQRGADAIALEASDDSGVHEATDAFLRLLQETARADESAIALPRLFECRLAPPFTPPARDSGYLEAGLEKAREVLSSGLHTSLGGYLAVIARRYLAWQDPLDARLYAEVFKFYRRNAVSDQRKYGGAWGFDSDFPSVYTILGWDLIEHDPCLSDADRLEVTQAILQWINEAILPEAAEFSLDSEGVTSNHLTFCSLGATAGALYFSKNHPALKTPADWLAIAAHTFERQTAAGKVMDDCNAYQWLTWNHCAVFSLNLPDDAFFATRCHAGRITSSQGVYVCGQTMDNLWTQSPYGDDNGWASNAAELPFLRIMHAATQDALAGTLLALKASRWSPREDLPGFRSAGADDPLARLGVFNGDWHVQPTAELDGMQITPLDPVYYRSLPSPMPVPPCERCFDKLSFRKALARGAFYALVDGVNNGGHRHEDAASFLRLSLFDREWLMENEYIKPQQKFHNTLLYLAGGEAFALPDYIELAGRGETDAVCWVFLRANGFGPADWIRRIFWFREEDALVVVDELQALKPGRYQVRQRWNALGRCTARPDGIQLDQQGPALRLQSWGGARLSVREDADLGKGWESYPYAQPRAHVLDQVCEADLRKGARITIGIVLHGRPDGDVPPWGFQRTARGFALDTSRRRYRLEFGADSLAACTVSDGDGTPLPEPPASAGGRARRLPGAPLEPVHACRLRDGREPSEVTCILPFAWQGGERFALSTRQGAVHILDGTARRLSSFAVGAPVHDLAACDLDGDGAPELLLACGDCCLRACRIDGTPLWKHDFPHYRLPAVCTLVRVADLLGDGRPVILAGCDSWRVYALDLTGAERWNFEVIHPTRALEVADLDGDGRLEILCGTRYYYATVLDACGRKLWGGHFARGVKAIAGVRAGARERTLVVGEDKGLVSFYRPVGSLLATFATGDEVMRAAPVRRADTDLREDVLACSRNGFAYRFDCDGRLLWARDLGAPVLLCRALPDGTAVFGTEAGKVVLIRMDGTIAFRHALRAPVADLRVLDGRRIAAATARGAFAVLSCALD